MKIDLFQSYGHCWVFQICWHIECSTFTALSFRIWNSSTGILSPPLALFIVMLSKAHLTSRFRMPGSRWVITASWLSGSWRSFKWQSTPELLPGKSHGWRSLIGYSPWDHKESDMTEQLPFPYFPFCVFLPPLLNIFCFCCFIDYAKAFDCVDHKKLKNSERDGHTRPPDLPLEKPVYRSGSNS